MKKLFKCALVIVKDNKFLINRKSINQLFLMPGGKPLQDEDDISCLKREIKEEHDCDIIKDSIKFLAFFEDKAVNEKDTVISMNIYVGKIKGVPIPSSEIIEQRWFGKNDDLNLLSPIIRNKILPFLMEKGIIY